MILIDSIYIHQSGGKTLLNYFLSKLENEHKDYTLLLDSRIDKNCFSILNYAKSIIILKPNEYGRKLFYKDNYTKFETIFCFSNIPPPISIHNTSVYIYFHNVLLLSNLFEENGYTLFQNFKFLLKKFYLNFHNKNEYNWVVQTDYIKSILKKKLWSNKNDILTIPFFKINEKVIQKEFIPNTFLYVADGVSQKNHIRLFEAFEKLFNEGINLQLTITLPRNFNNLNNKICILKEKGLQIDNNGTIDTDKLVKLYRNKEFLIFPSLRESFGLPLLEAAAYGCKVIASDLPYVNAIINPTDTFNPYDTISIYNSIIRNINSKNKKDTSIIIKNNITDLIKILTKK